MEEKIKGYLLVPPQLMWVLAAINYLFPILWITGNLAISETGMQFGIFLGIVIVTWLLFLADALSADLYQKSFWVVSLVILPLVTYPVYLLRRRRMIEMNQRFLKNIK